MSYNLKTLEFNNIISELMNYCLIEDTKDFLLNIKPVNQIDVIRIQLDEVKNALHSINKYNDIPINNLEYVKNALKRSKAEGILNEIELLDVALLIKMSTDVISYKKELSNLKIDTLEFDKYIDKILVNKKLEKEITDSIGENGVVLSSASNELLEIRNNLSSNENRLRSKMNELLISRSKMLNENLIVIRNDKLCLPVKVEYKNTFKGAIHDESASQTTVYIEPQECFEINSTINKLKHDEKVEVRRIIKSLSKKVTADCETLFINYEMLLSLDLIFAKAKIAINNDYNYPSINNEGIIKLKDARHPLIDKDKIVPIDIQLGKENNVIIITGPNTGGKTVALKTIGLITCMLQSGMFVPCHESSDVAIFDNVFVDIGDEQSIEMSLSTFSSHMTKIIDIVNNITPNSLILLDELGSGTDPKEGSSLAVSIIDYLKKANTRLIVTTHYSDLKAYALANSDILNASVEFDDTTLKPTYKLLLGVGGKSNAIMISRRLGLKESIINDALDNMKGSSSLSDNLIDKIDEEHIQIKNIKDDLEHKINQYNKLLSETNALREELKKNEDRLLKEAKDKANNILEKAKEDAAKLIEQLSNMKHQSFKEHELADLKHQTKKLNIEEDKTFIDYDYKVGDTVYIKKYERHSVINKIKKDKYEINIGSFAMLFSKEEISPSNQKEEIKKLKPYKKPVSTNKVSSSMSSTLDLRGYRFEEVANEIDKFIDNAYLKNIDIVSIIHGHGTGAIRKAVWEYLKTSNYVKEYRYGKEGEGLNGATIVTLK